jgi:hypothetical protein
VSLDAAMLFGLPLDVVRLVLSQLDCTPHVVAVRVLFESSDTGLGVLGTWDNETLVDDVGNWYRLVHNTGEAAKYEGER